VLRLRADTSKHDAEPPLANWTARIETRTATYGNGQTFRWKLLDGNYHGFLTKPAAVFKNRVDPASRTTSMRCRLIGLTFAISIVPVVANAQLTIDMGKITCDQYLAMPPAQSDNFSAWMSGWFSYQNRRTFVDILLHQKNIAIVKDWCKYHPTESVMSGLQKSLGTN
jgi:hypothetical protein